MSYINGVRDVTVTASGTLVALVFELVKVTVAIFGTVFYWTASAEVLESLHDAEDELASETDSA